VRVLKSFLRRFVLHRLEGLTHWRLRKLKPKVIGLTGSVGKTSTKEVLYLILSRGTDQKIHRNKKSLNSEFGALLTVLDEPSGYSSLWQWLAILTRAGLKTLFTRRSRAPYDTLILEMGADHAGDIDYLTRTIPPQIGLFLNVKSNHLGEGGFASLDEIFQEKSHIVTSLPKTGLAILNADDERVVSLKNKLNCNLMTFGTTDAADISASDIQSSPNGLTFTVHHKGQSTVIQCPHILGNHHVYVILPAMAVGLSQGISLESMADILVDFRLPPGRMSRLEGICDSTLIDSSYNASPESMLAALDVLESLPGRKIAALGTMNELGDLTESAHKQVGERAAEVADVLIAVGENASIYAHAAEKGGLPQENIHVFETSFDAGAALRDMVKPGDVILAKGSQNQVRMEHLVKQLMRYPDQASSLLVRQDAYWQRHL
jgi:UDP-N-acetylmuramoyl-tripeptide--D-alanyl-D-alanine ligase